MRNRYLTFIAFFLLVALFSSCLHQKEDKSNYKLKFIRKTERINQNSSGKQLDNLSFLDDSTFLNHDKIVLLITANTDCTGCRTKGYRFVSRINETFNIKVAFIVGTGLYESFEKRYNMLIGKIYRDEKSILKQKLNLFHTPSLVLIDKNDRVDCVLSIFPYDNVDGYDEAEKFNEFIEAVIRL